MSYSDKSSKSGKGSKSVKSSKSGKGSKSSRSPLFESSQFSRSVEMQPSFSNIEYIYDYLTNVPPPFENLIGYSPKRKLGIGSYGASILYSNNKTSDKKVLKVTSSRNEETFKRETSVLKVLKDNNLCEKYNISCFDQITRFPEVYMYTMNYIKGETLWEYLKSLKTKKKWGEYNQTCIDIFLSLVESLNYIHSRGVIHNDVKGNNIIIKDDKTPVLIDFGLAGIRKVGNIIDAPYIKSPFHPGYGPYYSGNFYDATYIDFYSLKRTFNLKEVPKYDMLKGIPLKYQNQTLNNLCYNKENMTRKDWKDFFSLIEKIK